MELINYYDDGMHIFWKSILLLFAKKIDLMSNCILLGNRIGLK